VLDTSADVEERQIAYWRAMSPKERFDLVAALNESCEQMAAAGVRLRYPNAAPTRFGSGCWPCGWVAT
jgi:hypothetical protein